MKPTELARREDPRYAGRDLLTLNQGSEYEVELDIGAGIIDCLDVIGDGSNGHLTLARVLADRVAEGERFQLLNVPEAMRKEFRRAAERRGVKVYAGAARNEYGEVLLAGLTEFKLKEA